MPEFRMPRTAAEWAAVTEKRAHIDYVVSDWWRNGSEAAPHGWLDLAAASRLLEREICKDEDAHLLAGYLSTLPGNTDKHPSEMLPEARRILEDSK